MVSQEFYLREATGLSRKALNYAGLRRYIDTVVLAARNPSRPVFKPDI